MTDREPILPLQSILDESPGQALEGCHGRNRSHEPGAKPTAADASSLPADGWRQHALPTAGIHSLRSGRRMIRCSVISRGATTGRSIT